MFEYSLQIVVYICRIIYINIYCHIQQQISCISPNLSLWRIMSSYLWYTTVTKTLKLFADVLKFLRCNYYTLSLTIDSVRCHLHNKYQGDWGCLQIKAPAVNKNTWITLKNINHQYYTVLDMQIYKNLISYEYIIQ